MYSLNAPPVVSARPIFFRPRSRTVDADRSVDSTFLLGTAKIFSLLVICNKWNSLVACSATDFDNDQN